MTIGIDSRNFMLKWLGANSTRNISLEGYAYSRFSFCCVNCDDTQDLDVFWEIQKADGEIESYTGPELDGVQSYQYDYENYLDRGVRIYGYCDFQDK